MWHRLVVITDIVSPEYHVDWTILWCVHSTRSTPTAYITTVIVRQDTCYLPCIIVDRAIPLIVINKYFLRGVIIDVR